MEFAKIMPPTQEEIERAGQELYNELVKTESQPLETMRLAHEVFAEARARLVGNNARV